MLEPRRLERVLLHFGHLDDPLFAFFSTIVSGRVADVRGVIVAFWNVFRLGSLDLAVGDLFQGLSGSLCRRHDRFLIGSLHLAVLGRHVTAALERHQVCIYVSCAPAQCRGRADKRDVHTFKTGLNARARCAPMLSNRVVSDRPIRVDLQGQGGSSTSRLGKSATGPTPSFSH